MSEVKLGFAEGRQVVLGLISQGQEQIAVFKIGALGPRFEEVLRVSGILDQLIFLQRAAVLGNEVLLVIDPDFLGVGLEAEHFVGIGERDAVAIGFKLEEPLGSAFHIGQNARVIIDGWQGDQKDLFLFLEEIEGSVVVQ